MMRISSYICFQHFQNEDGLELKIENKSYFPIEFAYHWTFVYSLVKPLNHCATDNNNQNKNTTMIEQRQLNKINLNACI